MTRTLPGKDDAVRLDVLAQPSPAVSQRPGLGVLWFFVGLTLLVLATTFGVWLVMVRPAQSAAKGLRDIVAGALADITGQQVTIHANTVTVAKSNIAELNLVQRKTQTVVKFESQVFGSRKTLILRGDFIAKAGFDLTKPFEVEVDEKTGEVKANFPPAKVTSVELKNYEVFFSNDGLINKLRPEDQAMATQHMIAQARLDATRSDIVEEAETQLRQRLRDLIGRDAKKILIRDEEIRP